MSENTCIIETCALQKWYGSIHAVNDLHLQVRAGNVYGILGPNGSGKSTLLRLLPGLVRPDVGTIPLFGLPLATHRDRILRRVGALIEKPDFYEYLSAYHNLALLSRLAGLRLQRQQIMGSLEQAGLAARAYSKVKTFSQGMRQRLGIAQALLHDPELLILDETTNGLDPQGVADVRALIVRLNQEHGKTVLLASHLLHELELVASHVLVLHQGQTVVAGAVHDLLQCAQVQVRLLVDEPQTARQLLEETMETVQVLEANNGHFVLSMAVDQVPLLTGHL